MVTLFPPIQVALYQKMMMGKVLFPVCLLVVARSSLLFLFLQALQDTFSLAMNITFQIEAAL